MHTKSSAETIRDRLMRDRRAIDCLLADSSIDALTLERLPNGEHAWLKPEPTPPLAAGFVPKDRMNQYVIATQTRYVVYAPSIERALGWFTDTSDAALDVETLDFGTVEFVEEIHPSTEHRRYWITERGRGALAEACASARATD